MTKQTYVIGLWGEADAVIHRKLTPTQAEFLKDIAAELGRARRPWAPHMAVALYVPDDDDDA